MGSFTDIGGPAGGSRGGTSIPRREMSVCKDTGPEGDDRCVTGRVRRSETRRPRGAVIRVEKRRKSPNWESPQATENAFCVHCLQATVLMSRFPAGTPPELSAAYTGPSTTAASQRPPWPALDCSPTEATKDTRSLVV